MYCDREARCFQYLFFLFPQEIAFPPDFYFILHQLQIDVDERCNSVSEALKLHKVVSVQEDAEYRKTRARAFSFNTFELAGVPPRKISFGSPGERE